MYNTNDAIGNHLNGIAPRVFLGDLCYLHDWDQNQPVPLNVGYIAAYLRKHQPDIPIEVFKNPQQLSDRISDCQPSVLALSHYDWNANLDLAVLRLAKNLTPNVISVLGGPNFQADSRDWVKDFFAQRPEVDLYITGEGEWSFNRLIQLLDKYGVLRNIPYDDLPSSFYQLDRGTGQIIHNPNNPVARLDLTTVPSPYLMGFMDPFLDDAQLAPIFETNRGCPYACTFCCWGQATQSKVNQFSLHTVKEEIRYAIERTKNPSGFVYIADGNFGILCRDLEIADVLQQCSKTYGIPKHVFIYFAKNTNDRVMQVAEKLNVITSMSMSKQTVNVQVLENIKRENIPIEQYDALRVQCENLKIDTFCELIYGLPGESYRSFVDGVIKTVRGGQRVILYPYIMLHGAENSTQAYRAKYGIKTAYRIIPRYICNGPDFYCLEYEEIVVATHEMPFIDYLRIRVFQFLSLVLGREMFTEFSRALEIVGLDYASLADFITHDDENWTPLFAELMHDHRLAVQNELIPEDQIKLEFTANDVARASERHILTLPNLISKSARIRDLHTYLRSVFAGEFGAILTHGERTEVMLALQFSIDKIVCFDNPKAAKFIEYEYNVDAWMMSDKLRSLKDFRCEEPIRYRLELDPDVLPLIERAKTVLGDLAQAVYRVRINLIRGLGDRVYCYKRVAWTGGAVDTHVEMEREHLATKRIQSEIAIR